MSNQSLTANRSDDFAATAAEFEEYLANPGNFPDPYPLFKRVRDVEPLHWSDIGTWIVLGHPEARAIFGDRGLSRQASAEDLVGRINAPLGRGQQALETFLDQFVNLEGAEHKRIRGLVNHAFAPRAVRAWESVIVQTVAEVVASLEDKNEFDVLHEYGYVIPSRVICAMVGVPFEDHLLFENWTTSWLNVNFTDPSADVASGLEPLTQFVEYMRQMVRQRRQSRQRDDDLVSILLDAEEEEGKLSEREVVASILNLVVGGHETVANLIANSMLALDRNPDQREKLRADRQLVVPAVEEFLRYDSPARSQPRIATQDVTVGDKVIRKGDPVQVIAFGVNRDARVFDQPDELRIDRSNNGHLAFGAGAHFCIGVHIARLEARHAIDALLHQFGPLEGATDQVVWRNAHVRAMTALPMRRV